MSRIVSLAPSNTEILCALGLSKEIVGVTEFCDFPPEAEKIPRLNGWIKMDTNEIAALGADLVLTSTVCQEKLRKKLEQEGISHTHLDPRTLAEVEDSILKIGMECHRQKEAANLIQRMRSELQILAENIPPNAIRPRLYCEEWHKPPMVSGNWVPELMEKIGADYFPIHPGNLSRAVTLQETQSFDPQIIVFSICGLSTRFDPAELFKREGWETIEAVQTRRVFVIDDSLLNRPGPRLTKGAQLIQTLLGQCFWGWGPLDTSRQRKSLYKLNLAK